MNGRVEGQCTYIGEKRIRWMAFIAAGRKGGEGLGRQPRKNRRTTKKRWERRTATSRIGQPWKTVALNWRAPFLDTYCAPPRAARNDRGEEGSAIEIAGGPRGDCIQAHIETHPRDVSELPANRMSAFHRRHHLPRCDVHSKEKEGGQGFGNRIVVVHEEERWSEATGRRWCRRYRMTRMRGTPYFDPINWTKRPLWKFAHSFGRLAITVSLSLRASSDYIPNIHYVIVGLYLHLLYYEVRIFLQKFLLFQLIKIK